MNANTVKNAPCSADCRVWIVYGSPHTDGATARLLNAFTDALPKSVDVFRLNCFERHPLPCTDCRACHTIEGCAFHDLDDVYDRLESADVLVFATPVYNLSFPAPMKAVIDRMQRYWAARFIQNKKPPIAKPKQAVLLTVSGADSPDNGEMVERQLKPVLTVLHAKLTHIIHYSGTDRNKDIHPHLAQAAEAARQLTIMPQE